MSATSFTDLNPRANVFIFVNLGCEMLYVIDQRLKAQNIELHKSVQVMNEVTAVFLDEKFIDSLIVGSVNSNGKILSIELCKFMLNDIAHSSSMRLQSNSMDKLWNLMTTIYKWQLFHSKHQHHLLDITFRHLDGITPSNSNENLCKIIDCAKNKLLEFWNSTTDELQLMIYSTNKLWLEYSTTKISLLMRLGFQALDGSLIRDVKSTYFKDFQNYLGENIYIKAVKLAAESRRDETSNNNATVQHINDMAEFLNLNKQSSEVFEFEQNLQQCNIIFNNLEKPAATTSNLGEFVHLETVYKRHQLITK